MLQNSYKLIGVILDLFTLQLHFFIHFMVKDVYGGGLYSAKFTNKNFILWVTHPKFSQLVYKLFHEFCKCSLNFIIVYLSLFENIDENNLEKDVPVGAFGPLYARARELFQEAEVW